jgi:hypothetical protein
MDEEDIFVYPGHEIHLARNTNGAKEVFIQVFHKSPIINPPANSVDYQITDVTLAPTTQIIIQAGGMAAVCTYDTNTRKLQVPASGLTGQDTLLVTFKPTLHITYTKSIKVFVHDRLDDWWLGNNSLTVPQDKRVFHSQISVFGHFDAPNTTSVGVIADITGHGFVSFVVNNTTICELDTFKRGRVKGLTTGLTQVQASFSGKTIDLPVNVINFYGDPTNARDPATVQLPFMVLEKMTSSAKPFQKPKDKFSAGSGMTDRFNFLFLGEGFTSAEKTVFDTAVNHFVQQLINSDLHQPFKMCGDSLNFWKAFIPSAESSIVDKHQYSVPAPSTGNSLLQITDSYYGIYKPKRPSDVLYLTSDFYMSGDPRRYPPELNWAKCIGRHIASLTDGSGNRGSIWYNDAPIDPNGADFLKDFGLVVIFYNVDSTYHVFTMGFANYGLFVLMPLAREANSTDPLLERGSSNHQWKLVSRFPPVPAQPAKFFASLNFTSFVLAHELAHSFDLGDEYESSGGNYPNKISPHSNITSFAEVRDGTSATQISSANIKWGAYDRMEKSDRILNIESLTIQGNGKWQIQVKLASLFVTRWEVDKKAGIKLYLRGFRVWTEAEKRIFGGLEIVTKNFHRFPRFEQVFPSTTPPTVKLEPQLMVIKDMEIMQILAPDKLELEFDPSQLPATITGATNQLDALRTIITVNGFANGILYKPKKTSTSPIVDKRLVMAEVSAYIDSNKIPLDRNGSTSTQGAEKPPATLINTRKKLIGNLFPHKVIGLYEGGDHAHDNVFRPTGDCRMRNSYNNDAPKLTPSLCYVCQYYLVSLLNPAMLEVLEKEYPDF